ncbi:MAG: hypothetical protein WBP93_04240 [Pyrinomonadaceae bacterium]
MKKIFRSLAIILLLAVAASAQSETQRERSASRRGHEEAKKSLINIKSIRKYDPRVLRLGPSTTFLNNGLSVDEVLSVLGKPAAVSEEQDGKLNLATYIFPRSEGRVLVAEFENGVLVRSRTETAEELAQSEQTGR